ncbi:MAG: DUF1273 domain-containing protein [Clostridiales bacterium]|nr:DUF1273 domain-containing protein [Clostridiales bacterium]
MEIEKTCAFTGHRQLEEDFDDTHFKEVLISFIEDGYNAFLCGMAMGFDMLAAEHVLKLKENYPEIKLVACVPCEEQSKYFPAEQKARYKKILQSCDDVRILNPHYFKGCMQLRDRYMVDNSSVLIAYKRVNEGGTFYTLKYALSENKKICLL